MTGTAAALGAAAFSLSACTDDGTAEAAAEVDQLTAQAERARADAAAATAAIALAPDKSASLTTISAERTAHALELDAEIARAAGGGAATTTAPPSTSVANAPTGVESLSTSLADSARSAADLARTMSGYRAGLLGSISASCSTQVAVLLP
ncbi:hypothetical protein ACIQYW_22605 [Rhodococcus erythropolis]|jgi:hypothetical protein|uniref:Uncharacterized protein n=1 Tax=Rhodococcus baikonurensis TaxID=172041 RepID=A0ABV5XAF6_9NOCA|nr:MULTISPECIES: hypothetical protein [Rhodococcus]MBJ7478945.1 hypothetical protein [Rhodococcus sp. (in: high G+C Gram-positive bacteria)]MDI9956249.1 hypothetical protein [Rhodococcus sp. IEGM 1237]MDI9965600.1 hypothetical protein [Rhodococcus sp. IEGM 1251]MDV8124696.1 hypothetical protein [Rhodococcus sp. IEGM 1304]PBI97724.1 hypothetical protein BKP42_29990 [Rhodococcus erythropolis]